MKKLALICFIALIHFTSFAQSKASIADADVPLTWLGIDYSQLKFIGNAAQWQDAGEITTAQLVQKYFPAWNNLFINEASKFDVAKATKRAEVKYAIDVTEKANNKLSKRSFFTDDLNDYKRLTDADISKVVSGYNFMGNKGLGLLFITESMSKGKEAASIWITFVDMNTKKVVFTKQMDAEAGGFGFRNYWAKPNSNALKSMSKNLSSWAKK